MPVPTTLHHKDNVVYMRFMGEDGWPAPKLRELDFEDAEWKQEVACASHPGEDAGSNTKVCCECSG